MYESSTPYAIELLKLCYLLPCNYMVFHAFWVYCGH